MERADAALRLREKYQEAGQTQDGRQQDILTLSGDVRRSPALLRELAVESQEHSSAEGLALQQVQSRAPQPQSLQPQEAEPVEPVVIAVQPAPRPPRRPRALLGETQPRLSLVPAMLADLRRNFFCYLLIAVLCALSLFKVYQVQRTRDLTSQLNEVRQLNENLDRQWLVLTSQRQTLSEHDRIRRAALNELHMQAPKPDAELMIVVKTP